MTFPSRRLEPLASLAVSLDWGRWAMRASPDLLAVRAEAADEDSLRRIQDPGRAATQARQARARDGELAAARTGRG